MKKILLILLVSLFAFLLSAQKTGEAKQVESNVQVFEDIDKEYKLVSYFLNFQQKKYYHSLEEEQKSVYLQSFWEAYNPNPVTEKNEFLELIRERIAYCNHYFSHFSDGWETDRGRIYIRHGKPFDIMQGRTSIMTKFTVKDYQIWKYRMNEFMTFIFLDQQGHGDYRIIYSDGDEKEMTNPDWQELLGPDFEQGDLY